MNVDWINNLLILLDLGDWDKKLTCWENDVDLLMIYCIDYMYLPHCTSVLALEDAQFDVTQVKTET